MTLVFNVSAIEIWEALGQVLPAYLSIILSSYIGNLSSVLQCIVYEENSFHTKNFRCLSSSDLQPALELCKNIRRQPGHLYIDDKKKEMETLSCSFHEKYAQQ